MNAAIQAATDRLDWIAHSGDPVSWEAQRSALDALNAAQLTDIAETEKKLAWHRSMLAQYEAKDDWFGAREHRGWIEECVAALAALKVAA